MTKNCALSFCFIITHNLILDFLSLPLQFMTISATICEHFGDVVNFKLQDFLSDEFLGSVGVLLFFFFYETFIVIKISWE